MSQIPDTIVLRRDRDFEARHSEIWVRRGLFALVCLVPVLALFNVFGQRPDTSTGTVAAARMSVSAPTHVRDGLLYAARFEITARQTLHLATLVLDDGWVRDLTVNTIEPSPAGQTSQDGKLVLTLGHIPAGQSYVLYLEFQVNPTNLDRRSQSVTLYDGNRSLLTLHRTLTIFP